MSGKSSSTRVREVWQRSVDNDELLQVLTVAARAVQPQVFWPAELPASDAPRIAHAYVKHRTKYVRESGDQIIRTPKAFVRTGVGDCKTTALFIGTLSKAAGHRVVLRFVSFPGRDHYGHVYAVVDGVPHDPLMDVGQECVYLRRKDVHL